MTLENKNEKEQLKERLLKEVPELEKSGWKIIKKELWKNPSFKLGIRPFLRNFTNRYYAVYAERDKAGRWPNRDTYTNYYRGILNI